MATLSSPGVGSGLDVNGLVTQLMAAARAPETNRLSRESTQVGTQISALGSMKGALSGFNTALTPLKTVDAFSIRTATSGDDDVFTATATSKAAPSLYNVRVTGLATAQQLVSTAFVVGSNAVVGSGDLTISLGTTSFKVTIDPAAAHLADVRDAINAAGDNPGVRAAIVQADDGAHLVLTSSKTGATNKIKVTTTSVDGLAQLTYDSPGNTSHYTQKIAAQDSTITIAGFTHHSDSNVVSDAIDGVTLTLKKESEDGVDVPLTIEANKAGAVSNIKKFVSQYNSAMQTLNDLGKYDATTGNGGPLLGDALLRSVIGELRRGISDAVSGLPAGVNALAQIGITSNKDGSLLVDDTKLNAALASNFDNVGRLFGGTNGVAARLSTAIDARLAGSAEIASRNKTLDQRTKAIAKEKTQLDDRMTKLEANYRRQFSALDRMMSQSQSTSSFLTQQLANLPKL